MSTLVVDASVATNVFLGEPLALAAEAVFQPSHRLHAPDFFLLEIHNALLKKERRKEITASQSGEARESFPDIPIQYHSFQPFLNQAYEIASKAGCSLYDAVYVTLAVRLDCPVVTADRRLFKNLSTGSFSKHVWWVEDLSK